MKLAILNALEILNSSILLVEGAAADSTSTRALDCANCQEQAVAKQSVFDGSELEELAHVLEPNFKARADSSVAFTVGGNQLEQDKNIFRLTKIAQERSLDSTERIDAIKNLADFRNGGHDEIIVKALLQALLSADSNVQVASANTLELFKGGGNHANIVKDLITSFSGARDIQTRKLIAGILDKFFEENVSESQKGFRQLPEIVSSGKKQVEIHEQIRRLKTLAGKQGKLRTTEQHKLLSRADELLRLSLKDAYPEVDRVEVLAEILDMTGAVAEAKPIFDLSNLEIVIHLEKSKGQTLDGLVLKIWNDPKEREQVSNRLGTHRLVDESLKEKYTPALVEFKFAEFATKIGTTNPEIQKRIVDVIDDPKLRLPPGTSAEVRKTLAGHIEKSLSQWGEAGAPSFFATLPLLNKQISSGYIAKTGVVKLTSINGTAEKQIQSFNHMTQFSNVNADAVVADLKQSYWGKATKLSPQAFTAMISYALRDSSKLSPGSRKILKDNQEKIERTLTGPSSDRILDQLDKIAEAR